MRIEPQFDYTLGFSRRAILLLESVRNQMPWLIDCEWEPTDVDEPLAQSLAPVRMSRTWGYIDATGRIVISPQFDEVRWFSEGLAPAAPKGGKWGYINPHGEWIIKPQYARWPPDFHEGLARIITNGKAGFIDQRGNWVIRPTLDRAGERFSCGLVSASPSRPQPYGFIDRKGDFIIAPQFGGVFEFSEGLARFAPWKTSWGRANGYIDTRGVVVVQPIYQYADDFSEGMAAVNIGGIYEPPEPVFIGGGEWGYIDLTGKVVIPLRFAYAGKFHEGLAATQEPDEHKEPGPASPAQPGEDRVPSAYAPRTGKWGFIDKTGRYVIPPTLDFVSSGFYHGIAKVVKEGRICYINKSGTVIWRGAAVDRSPY
jgi:hypothetical protein